MPRRRVVAAREILPDPKFGSQTVAKFINHVMSDGKKSTAERIVYGALETVSEKRKVEDPVSFFEEVLENVRPMVEVKARRVGGSTYQVPMEVDASRGTALALRWIISSARTRSGRTMAMKLANELVDASEDNGAAVRKRNETHRMAEANKAFAHFRY